MKNSNDLALEKKEEISQGTLLMEFETIRPKLKSYLFRITAHKEDTEDLLQETYIKVSDNLFTFQNKSSLKTWIFAVATNLAKDYLRVPEHKAESLKKGWKQYYWEAIEAYLKKMN